MPTWETSTDWDLAASESGVEHESVASTANDDATRVEQGYSWASPPFASSLVALYPFQETSGSTAEDKSGNNNDGTINGATPNGDTGPLGTPAYDFDGSDDYVDIPSPSQLSAYTVLIWLYLPTFSSIDTVVSLRDNNGHLMRTRSTTTGDQGINDGIEWAHSDGGSTTYVETSMPVDAWTLIGVTWDGSTLRFYKDGIEVDSASVSSTASKNGASQIGGRTSVGRYWSGSIGPTRIDNSALSASTISDLYDVVTAQSTLTTATKSL